MARDFVFRHNDVAGLTRQASLEAGIISTDTINHPPQRPKQRVATAAPVPPPTEQPPTPKPHPKTKARRTKRTSTPNPKPKPSTTTASDKGDYRAIELEEFVGEIPCYDNATTVRRKLNKLITDKSTISGTSKKWNKSTMVAEMQELEKREHPVEYNKNASGPTARSLGGFL